jgi:hypothetical protein
LTIKSVIIGCACRLNYICNRLTSFVPTPRFRYTMKVWAYMRVSLYIVSLGDKCRCSLCSVGRCKVLFAFTVKNWHGFFMYLSTTYQLHICFSVVIDRSVGTLDLYTVLMPRTVALPIGCAMSIVQDMRKNRI